MGIESKYLPTVAHAGRPTGSPNVPLICQVSTRKVQRLRLKKQVKPRRDARDALIKKLGMPNPFGRKR